MKAQNSPRKIDSSSYNASSGDFIPIACHFDPYTLITKNGELIQTFQINGINSEKISKTLFNLRKMVRQAIKDNISDSNFAIWIHTIRRKADLDDETPYNSFFSANIHDIWCNKNYWHDKFVNRLYVSVVHTSPAMKIRNFNTLVNSLSSDVVAKFEESYHDDACHSLTKIVDNMLASLSEFGATKLGIRIEDDICYSDPMFLYRSIMQLNEEYCLVPITDISTALSSHQYAVGTDMMEVIDNDGKKFAGVISLKDYQEVSSEALDKFLQIPVELVATEVFYFVNKKEVVTSFEHQNYILSVSKDAELAKLKGLNKMFETDDNEENKFCHQQISFMVVGNNINELEQKIHQASLTLSKIGIVHVREDINLEKTFWSQLPGNFSYLSRMIPTVLDNTAAMASLHNFPTGNQYNPWGKAVTLFRTEKGTPYFMNFHNLRGEGFTCIFGTNKSGRTTLMNFLLSEADKFNPTIIHFVDDLDSGIYVKAKEGIWFQREKEIINPFLVGDTPENRKELLEFMKIIANHYFDPLQEVEVNLLVGLVEEAFKLADADRLLSKIISKLDATQEGAENLLKRLANYAENGLFYQVFEKREKLAIEDGGEYLSFNLMAFDDEAYTKTNFPKEKKLIDKFEYDLNALRSVKAGIVYSVTRLFKEDKNANPKILAIDNLSEILNLKHYSSLLSSLNQELANLNGILFTTLSNEHLKKLYLEKVSLDILTYINTKIFLPAEVKMPEIENFHALNRTEANKLFNLVPSSRTFLISQDEKIIASELSIGGLPGLTRILSSAIQERDMYREVIKEFGEDVENWVQVLYEKLENIT